MTSEAKIKKQEEQLSKLKSILKQTKHHFQHLTSSSVSSEYFESRTDFKLAVDEFFDLDDEEIIAVYYLGYPLQGQIFFDHQLLTQIIKLIPEFLLSLVKTGKHVLFTTYQYQSDSAHTEIEITPENLLDISENIFYIWKQISEIEVSSESEEVKLEKLAVLPSVLKFNKYHYDLMGCFQMNLMSQVFYLGLRGVKYANDNKLLIYPDSVKRKLMEQVVGFLALPLVVAEDVQVSDVDLEDLNGFILAQVNRAGFIPNIHHSLSDASPYPQLEESTQKDLSSNTGEYVFQRIGSVWNIKFGPEIGQFKNLKGFNYIHEVLKLYPESIRPFDLDAGKYKVITSAGVMLDQYEMNSISASVDESTDEQYSTNHKKSDSPNTELAQAKEIKRQIRTMQESLDLIAEDSPQYFSKKRQLDEVQKFYNNNYTYTGRERMDDKNPDRARTAVTKAITRAKRELQYVMPEFFAHLDRHFKTGSDIQYSIQEDSVPDWLL